VNLAKYPTLRTASRLALLCLLAVAHQSNAGPPAAAQIEIKNFMFAPNAVTIKAGSTVTWSNKDDEPHTVVSDAGLFRSSAMDTDETFSFTFDKPGTYHFTCSIHPRMIGTITVE
jgi:plastocyanin